MKSLALLLAFWSSGLTQENYLVQSSGPFRFVLRDQSQSEAAKYVSNILQAALPRTAAVTGFELDREILVFITRDQADFDRYAGSMVPEWGEAFAIPAESAIILKSPELASKRLNYKNVVIHELTHVILFFAVDSNEVPVWFGEGLAMFTATEEQEVSELARALLTDSVIPLDRIDSILRFNRNKARLAYEESHSAVMFLAEAFGDSSLPRLVQGFKAGLNVDEALMNAISMDYEEFEEKWLEYAGNKYKWTVFLEADTILWFVIIPFLFLAAYVAVKLRNRRIKKQWTMEDENTSGATPPE